MFIQTRMVNGLWDLAEVKVNNGPTELWLYDYFTSPINLRPIVAIMDSREAGKTHNFDFSKIENLAYNTPISLDARADPHAGIVFENKQGNPEIAIRKRRDYRTLIHEFAHMCYERWPEEGITEEEITEEEIEIATEVAIQAFDSSPDAPRNLLHIIRESSMKGYVKRFQPDNSERLERELEDFSLYPEKYQGIEEERLESLSKYFFLDRLLSEGIRRYGPQNP